MIALVAALIAAPVTLQADPAHSSASFTVKHMMVSNVRGGFSKLSSTLVWDKEDPSKSSVEAKIDAASVDTQNEKRDGHLKSPDFFDTARCPDITFKSNKIEKAGDKYKVTGDLTMHCVTKPVTLDAEFTGPVKSPFGPFNSYGVSATGTLNRKDFGLVWNKALESGGMVVSEDVKLDLELEYSDAKPAGKEAKAEKADSTRKGAARKE
jgi:polyisoprenoid-binding protein YceI